MIFFSRQNKTPLDNEVPWITFNARKWLDRILTTEMSVFEWGSGGSTLYFAKRCGVLVSVEHDPVWFEKVASKLEGLTNLTYKLIEPHRGPGYRSSDNLYKGLSFEKYCKYILNFPDNSFDLVVVDGRARNNCIKPALSKIKQEGFLMLDNSERKIYESGIKVIKEWKRADFYGRGPLNRYPWMTSVFQKISS